MSDTSPVLSLPFIQAAQSQKHVTHNEALRVLDAVVQLVVVTADQDTPPGAPEIGARYIVAEPGSGAWAGQAGNIAVWQEGGWFFVPPQTGWRAEVLSPAGAVVFDAATGWAAPAQTTQQLGINATADTTNRLSISAPATLLNHEGAGHQLKLNKSAAGDTASLLYQTGYSGRAEMGLAGDDDFAIKVSADGSNWKTGLSINAADGGIAAPFGLESVQIIVSDGQVASLLAPSSSGFALLSSVSPNFPQSTASMILCYDVGQSPQLSIVWSGSAVTNLGNVLPTGTSAPDGDVGVAVQDDGRIYLENRHLTGNDLQYCVTFLNGWRALV